MLKIGTLNLHSNLILAPMAGISDLPFRLLNRRFGAELAFTEMINCRSISHKSRKTRQMLDTNVKDRPRGVQILGCEEKFILKALDVLKNYDFDLLDFNAACPVKKVVARGEGSALLKEPKKLEKLLKLVVENSTLPVTVKIRSGWHKDSVNAKEVALLAEDAGASAIFIHGRTRMQGYSGQVDYRVIAEVKQVVKIPVVASGDILSRELIKKMFDQTGCDAVVVARGALGNPWIFQGKVASLAEIIEVMVGHLDSYVDYYGERNGVILFRKFFAWYTKGFRKIRHLREGSSRAKTKKDMLALIERCR